MYTQYFGFTESPFSIAPDPRYLYMSERHREALAHLLYGVDAGGGFVLLTGEVGTGKTTVCRCLLEQMPEHIDLALILNPKLSPLELVAAVCDELHVSYDRENPTLKNMVDRLNQRLLTSLADGRGTVVIIDEAQQLSVESLEQLRLLTNLETNTKKLLQVILIGQPELQSLLTRQELRQLAQRVIARYHLLPLSVNEIAHYINHRLAVAGIRQSLFPPRVVRRLHQLTGGVPRLINTLCDRALLGAYAKGKRIVELPLIDTAAREVLGLSKRVAAEDAKRAQRLTPSAIAGWVAVLVIVAAMLFGMITYWPDVMARMGSEAPAQSPESDADEAPTSAQNPADEAGKPLAASSGVLESRLPARAWDPTGYRAFAAVYRRWNMSYDAATQGLPCAHAVNQGLRCYSQRGNWASLRKHDLPAVLKLMSPGKGAFYAALLSLSDTEAELSFGEDLLRLPPDELVSYWQGEYSILWQGPPPHNGDLTVGSRGTAVSWLRARLDALAGRPENPRQSDTFDAAMAKELKSFQAGQGLKATGIAGDDTLVLLSQAAPGAPRLMVKVK